MPQIVTLSGWAQPADALKIIAPGALHLDYMPTKGIREFFAQWAIPLACDLLIGWSLGGYIAVQAIAMGKIQPKHLLLLAPPFQCVASEDFVHGMSVKVMNKFKVQYRDNAVNAWKSFQALVALGDSKEKEIARQLLTQSPPDTNDGLRWLEVLATSSCQNVNFTGFPATTVIHGEKDAVIHPAQSERFLKMLPQASFELWPDCGHAPHLHDTEKLGSMVRALQ